MKQFSGKSILVLSNFTFICSFLACLSAENSTQVEQPVHPAAIKLAMRYHIQKMCLSPHCADSLVLYLNSPAMSDGSTLLWDANRDGVVSTDITDMMASR